MNALRSLLVRTAWPGLLAGSMWLTWALWSRGMSAFTAFVFGYCALVVVVVAVERLIPRTPDWFDSDGQEANDVFFTVGTQFLFSSAAGAVLKFATTAVLVAVAGLSDVAIWPRHWPMWSQVAIALCLVDGCRYWGHRLSHTTELFWRAHSLHHSAKRIWVLNTGRMHPLDNLPLLFSGIVIPLVGMPPEVVVFQAAFTAFVGLMAHSNIRLRLGALNYIFNTPVLHRWHHSNVVAESNHNYAHTLALWDLVFRSYHNPHDAIPEVLGIPQPFPDGILEQLKYPFTGWPLAVDRWPWSPSSANGQQPTANDHNRQPQPAPIATDQVSTA